jgi:4-hydroxybenzoate polyprenyltransferase
MSKPATTKTPVKPSENTTPQGWIDYWHLARMQKWPLGTMLCFWPVGKFRFIIAFRPALIFFAVWGYLLGYKGAFNLSDFSAKAGVFLVANTLLHSAICVINDICDKDLDAQVGMSCSQNTVDAHPLTR